METIHTDVCVIGAGPAGSVLAQRLAHLGHSVVVVERCAFPRPHIGESLAASVLPLLDVLNLRRPIENAGFLRPTDTLLCWAGPMERRLRPGEPGFQVDRGSFDAILLNAARAAGARVLQPARVTSARHDGGAWHSVVQTTDEPMAIVSRMLADASGRRGFLAGRRRRSGPTTIALAAYWRPFSVDSVDTRVEAGDRQWYWGAPLPYGRFVAAVFVDREHYREGLRAFGNRSGFYHHLLTQSRLLAASLRDRVTGVEACDASPCHDEESATPFAIKVGEAAFAIDPLSSQGVQTAIGSALHAAAVTHTILERPADADLAIEFYRRSQEKAVAFHARAAAAAYSDASRTRPDAYWQRRAAGHALVDDSPADAQPALRQNTIVRLADDVRVETAPVLRGDAIVAGRHVALPGRHGTIAFLGDVELAPLLDLVRQPVSVNGLADVWAKQIPPDRARAILDWLWANRALQRFE